MASAVSAWSSMRRMRRARRAGSAHGLVSRAADSAPARVHLAAQIGSRTVNVEPRPGRRYAAARLPPCSSTMARLMARPRPRPPNRRVMLAARPARRRRRSAAAAPARCRCRCRRPRRRAHGPAVLACRERTAIVPPVGRELDGVAEQVPEHLGQARRVRPDAVVSAARLDHHAGGRRPSARRTTVRRACSRTCRSVATSWRCSSSLPREMRVRSSRSSISRASSSTLRRIIGELAAQLGGQRGRCLQARDHGQDRRQRRAQLVAQGGEEAVLGFARRQDPLAPLLLGQIGHHQAKDALFVSHRELKAR